MKQFFIDNNSDKLILFFSGWGCDEYEFEHLNSKSDVLIFYDYLDLNYNFNFTKYKEINMLSFSAGVFIGSIFEHDFIINKKIAMSGNPYLFDERLGLSGDMIEFFKNINENNLEEFTRNYLIKTDEEYNNFHNSRRTLESCNIELDALMHMYKNKYSNIKDVYDTAIIGDDDPIFNPLVQKEFFGNRLKIIENARHNLFFRINSYEDIFDKLAI